MNEQLLLDIGNPSVVTQQSVARERELDEIIACWNNGEPADALAALTAAPHLGRHHSAVVTLAYEEYCQRLENGQTVDVAEFVAKFAPHDTALKKVLAFHHLEQGASRLPDRLEPGNEFLGYEVVDRLGRGAFSRVYLAVDSSLAKRPVVLKLTTLSGLEREALGTLESPYVVPVYAALATEGAGPTAIVMPFHGPATFEDLAAKLRTANDRSGQLIFDVGATPAVLPPRRPPARLPAVYARRPLLEGAVWLLRGVAEGLSIAHQSGYVHLDLKPSNILLAAGGCPMLADFNLSQRQDAQSLAVGGTVPYMAPEQLLRFVGQEGIQVGAPADIFSFGVVAHELLTGSHPYGPIDAGMAPCELAEVLLQRIQAARRPTTPAGANPSLCRLLDACLSIDAGVRPTADEVRRRLTRELGTTATAARIAARHPLAGALAVGFVVAALMGGALAWNRRPPVQQRNYAAAVEAFNRSDIMRATELIDKFLEVDPNHTGALALKARIAIEQGNYSEAIRFLEPLIGKSKDAELKSLYRYACVQIPPGKFDSAIELFQPLYDDGDRTRANLNNCRYALRL